MTTIPQPFAPVNIEHALLVCVSRAKGAYPDERVRIEKGLVICLAGGVRLGAQPGDDALIMSLTGPRSYRVNGHCECPDAAYNAPDGRCKHRWAKALMTKALTEVANTHTYYAQYEAPDRSLHMGTATWTAKGYCFIPADGGEPVYSSMAALTLGGRVDILEAQRLADGDLVKKVCGYA